MVRTITLAAVLHACTLPSVGAEEPANPPTFKLPKGWEAVKSGKSVIPALHFRAGEGQDAVAVVLLEIGGEGGGAVNNVNRWREQVGLKGLDAKEAQQALEPVKVDGLPGQLLDVTGSASGDKPAQRIVAVMVKSGDSTWFIRLSGAGAAVGKQKPAFDEFVKSIKFGK